MCTILSYLIEYLNAHALTEEGLYRIEGKISERNDLLHVIDDHLENGTSFAIDLSIYDPHSITSSIKYVRNLGAIVC